MKEAFLIASIVVSLLSPLIAILSIFKGDYKPQRTTRLIYVVIVCLYVATLFSSGERKGLFVALVQLACCIIIFALSIKYGMGGKNKLDFLVLIAAGLTLIIWYSTSNPVLALYLSILADFIGTSPSIIKSYQKPFTEVAKFYFCDVMASIFVMLSLESYGLRDVGFPGYIFLVNLVMVLTIVLRQRALKPSLQ